MELFGKPTSQSSKYSHLFRDVIWSGKIRMDIAKYTQWNQKLLNELWLNFHSTWLHTEDISNFLSESEIPRPLAKRLAQNLFYWEFIGNQGSHLGQERERSLLPYQWLDACNARRLRKGNSREWCLLMQYRIDETPADSCEGQQGRNSVSMSPKSEKSRGLGQTGF
jgi:hypothetical protein